MLKIRDGPIIQNSETPRTPALVFPYELDAFQLHGIDAIEEGDHLLVTAHTGSGKTTLAEYAIAKGLSEGKKVIYTAPIKALSNQMFADCIKKHPEWKSLIGIKTGDRSQNAELARILIMTTEILRNLLCKDQLLDVSRVIFDETHYIKDKQRGIVWEDSIMMMPPHIQMTFLSATLPDAETFSQWIVNHKGRNVSYVTTSRRVVPLTHYVLTEDKKRGRVNRVTIMDSKGTFDPEAYTRAMASYAFLPAKLNDYLSHIKLPALFFCFNRNACERYASAITRSLVDGKQSTMIDHEFESLLRNFDNDVSGALQTHRVRALAIKGVCFHHAGLLPQLKEIVQELFARGHIQVLFVTETFAAGVNLPAKSVVFTGFTKYDDDSRARGSFRVLYTEEYIQMAGRAGRRGLDDIGDVIHLPFNTHDTLSLLEVRNMMSGSLRPIVSNYVPDYGFLLRSILYGRDVAETLNNSLHASQLYLYRKGISDELDALTMTMAKTSRPSDEVLRHYSYKQRNNKLGKAELKKHKAYLEGLSKTETCDLEAAIKRYEDELALKRRTQELLSQLSAIDSETEEALKSIGKTLVHYGYLAGPERTVSEYTPADLTMKGLIAVDIHECNSMLLTELILNGGDILTGDPIDVIPVLGLFLEAKDTDRTKVYSPTVKSKVKQVSLLAEKVSAQFNVPIDLSDETCDVVQLWIKTGNINTTVIDTETELLEGEIVRLLLKLNNICREIQAAATLAQLPDVAKAVEGYSQLIVRGVVIPDSIYVPR